MALTKKEAARYRAITSQLARMSSNGWDRATHDDYAPLEAELRVLGAKMMTEPKPRRTRNTRNAVADRIDGYDRDDLGESPDY